jgi:hypothetical protein
MMEQTTAYVALENFQEIKGFIMHLFQMNMFSRCNTLNDILEALVGDASDFLQR